MINITPFSPLRVERKIFKKFFTKFSKIFHKFFEKILKIFEKFSKNFRKIFVVKLFCLIDLKYFI